MSSVPLILSICYDWKYACKTLERKVQARGQQIFENVVAREGELALSGFF
jgi:hypothetical protein